MNSITDHFKLMWYQPHGRYEIPNVPLEEGAFPAYLDIDISGNEFEVPVALLPFVKEAKMNGCNRLVFNLVNGPDREGRRTFHKKTIATILKQFTEASTSTMKIAHIVTSKNLHYYGCRGMIFNGNYEPLLIATVKVVYRGPDNRLDLSSPKCKLSYKVFEGCAEIVEKTIIKQAIPYFADNTVFINFDDTYYGEDNQVELEISHLGNMVVRPATPSLSTVSTIGFNNVIAEYETH